MLMLRGSYNFLNIFCILNVNICKYVIRKYHTIVFISASTILKSINIKILHFTLRKNAEIHT
jgi:hypothetical protein